MTGSIICGVDDSASARQAARVARVLAGRLGLRLVFVQAADDARSDAELSATAKRLKDLSGWTTDVDCGATWLVGAGEPSECLVDTAERRGAALIVIGSQSSGGIAGDLWRRAPCPVVVVPLDDHASGKLVTGAAWHGSVMRADSGYRLPGNLCILAT